MLMKENLRNLTLPSQANIERGRDVSTPSIDKNGRSLDVQYNQEKKIFLVRVIENFLAGVKEQIHSQIRTIATYTKGLKSSTASLKAACQQLIMQVIDSTSGQTAIPQSIPIQP